MQVAINNGDVNSINCTIECMTMALRSFDGSVIVLQRSVIGLLSMQSGDCLLVAEWR